MASVPIATTNTCRTSLRPRDIRDDHIGIPRRLMEATPLTLYENAFAIRVVVLPDGGTDRFKKIVGASASGV